MNDIDELIKKALEQKKAAKNEKKFSMFEDAQNSAKKSIEIFQSYKNEHTDLSIENKNKINIELADCCGVLGGIYRAWALSLKDIEKQKEKFKLSYESYENGYELEKECGNVCSYNMLNRCISQVFYDPLILGSNVENPERKKLIVELTESEKIISANVDTDSKDVWALADLALIKVLLQEKNSTEAYAPVVDERPLYDTYVSILSTLQPLSQLNLPVKQELESAVRYLQNEMPK